MIAGPELLHGAFFLPPHTMENLMNTPLTAVLGPPPAAVDLSEDRKWRDTAAVLTISIIAVIAVVIRFIVRLRSQKARPFLDEWLVAVTLVSESMPLVEAASRRLIHLLDSYADPLGCFISRWPLWRGKTCLGRDHRCHGENEDGTYVYGTAPRVDDKCGLHTFEILFAYLFIYLFELFLIKISILAFYRCILGMNWSIWICLFLTIGWTIGSMIALLVSSDPVAYFWTSTYDSKSGYYRYNFYGYYIGNAASNVVVDVLILLIPVPVIWRLKVRMTQKVMITNIFLIGVLYVSSHLPIPYPLEIATNISIFLVYALPVLFDSTTSHTSMEIWISHGS